MTLLESTAAIIVSIISILGSAAFGVRWLVKHYFDEIKHELKPNGGSSLKDQVNRLEKQQLEADQLRKDTNKKIDHLYDLFVDYVSKTNR